MIIALHYYPLVIGPISILKLSQLPGEYTALCCCTQCYSGYQTQYPSVPLVIGPISILKLSQLPGEYTALCYRTQCYSIKHNIHLYPWSLGQYQSLNFLSSLGSIQLCATYQCSHNIPSISTLIYIFTPWWRESKYGKVSCSTGHKSHGLGKDLNPHSDNSTIRPQKFTICLLTFRVAIQN